MSSKTWSSRNEGSLRTDRVDRAKATYQQAHKKGSQRYNAACGAIWLVSLNKILAALQCHRPLRVCSCVSWEHRRMEGLLAVEDVSRALVDQLPLLCLSVE
jgi:hypothetical protein